MALATPACILWKPCSASGPCRDASDEGRHAHAMPLRAEFSGAIVFEAPQQWECCRRACASRARLTCLLGGGGKRDAARKALEAALGEKKDAFSKWDEEIKKREESGGGGKGRGRGWGSGGGNGGGGSGSGGGGDANFGGLPAPSSNSWEDTKQMILAFLGLASLYLVLTQGKSMLAVSVNSALYVLRGFKKSGSSSSRPPALSRPTGDGPGPAESNVMSKWGKD